MTEFTFRSARSASQVVGLSLATAVEVAVTDALLHATHPIIASVVTVVSVAAIAWFVADYRARGRGTVRIEDGMLNLRVGRRVAGRVPLRLVATTSRATWRDIPAVGNTDGSDYRNLMKPAPPNVLVTLAEPSPIKLIGVTIRPRRLGLHLDDPAAFVSAMDVAHENSREPAIPS